VYSIPIKESEFGALGIETPVSAPLGDFQRRQITDDYQRKKR